MRYMIKKLLLLLLFFSALYCVVSKGGHVEYVLFFGKYVGLHDVHLPILPSKLDRNLKHFSFILLFWFDLFDLNGI